MYRLKNLKGLMMIKSGLIGAGISFVYIMSLTLLSPFCTLCLTPLLGIGVGYLASWFDKPLRPEANIVGGTIAGAITGLGAIAGQMVAAVVNAILVANSEQLPNLMREMGLADLVITNSDEYWQTTVAINSFCGVFNLALIVGLGAIGSMLWFQRHSKNSLSAISS